MNHAQTNAFHSIMGQLLDAGIHPDACRLFSPESFHSLATASILVHRETCSGAWMGPMLGLQMGAHAWQPDRILRTTILDVLREVPEVDPRSHVVAGYFLMVLLPIWDQGRRWRMARHGSTLMDYTRGEAPDAFDNLGREILRAYDHALDTLELARELTHITSGGEGAVMRISVYKVTVEQDDGEPGVEYHTLKGKARQTCQAAAQTGRQAELHSCVVEAEPRDILVAGLEGDLADYVEDELLERYTPTHELRLAPGAFAWELEEHSQGQDDDE